MTGSSYQTAADRLVAAALAITLSVRSREGLPAAELQEVYDSLAACATEWASLDAIPRIAVNALVDLQPTLLAASELYDNPTRVTVVKAAIHVGDRIREAVAV